MGDHADDAVFAGLAQRWGGFRRLRRVVRPTCIICGKPHLRWGNEKGGGWILIDPASNKKHVCLIPDKEGRLPKPRLI